MRQIVSSRWFALADLLLVLLSGFAWVAVPSVGIWFTVIACLPWIFRVLAGRFARQRTVFDWLIALFAITAGIGYWAAYNKDAAWSKLWFLLVAVLLYYALRGQPAENLGWVARIFFLIGVGVSIYFFLTHDFIALPRKLTLVNTVGLWIMQIRPSLPWRPIHPNYVAGVTAMMTPFAFFPPWNSGKSDDHWGIMIRVTIIFSLAIVALALVMTTSRGVFMAISAAVGAWGWWKLLERGQRFRGLKQESIFPILVLAYLILVITVLYAGPASFTGSVTAQSKFGNGSRTELLVRSMSFVRDFPFTGGGLDSFPGLYSNYILNVPSFYLPNSHNLFLDVAIEQGVIGGLAYLFLLMGSIWFVSRSILLAHSIELKIFGWAVLFALIISIVHGMVDDYLYNGAGTLLALSLAGTAMLIRPETPQNKKFSARLDYRIAGLVIVGFAGTCIISLNQILSAWYANLGAVQMAQVELADFPTGAWLELDIVPRLRPAEDSFRSALRYDADNETANDRLGLIYLIRRDFKSAAAHLEIADSLSPDNRGITKSLGYCYVWLGELDKAEVLLRQIPEAPGELAVYTWWWAGQDRDDLAEKAELMLSRLAPESTSP